MSEAKECDICHKFYKRYDSDDFDNIMLYQGTVVTEQFDLCPTCQKVVSKILYHGYPKWLPEEEYDPSIYDWVLVKLSDPISGELDPIPIVAEKRNGKWYARDDASRIIKWPVAYFLDISKVESILGGLELK